jgi:glycosyltransferase involved in cell wall biosynthesis
MTRPTCSLLVTTYNWPEALAAILSSVAAQRVPPDEVIVGDDGSGEPTRRLVEAFRGRLAAPLVHVWQPDDGFRLARIRNMSVAAATGQYIIQIDGDMILHPEFVRDHLDAAAPGCFIGGSRVVLGPEATRRALERQRRLGPFSPDIGNRLNTLRAPRLGRAIGRLVTQRSLNRVRGCNMSYWRSDFIEVNGYDEAYVGWGREDTDLVVRFFRYGLERRFFKLQGVAYHLHHRENPGERLGRNDDLLRETMRDGRYRCEAGVTRHLVQPPG